MKPSKYQIAITSSIVGITATCLTLAGPHIAPTFTAKHSPFPSQVATVYKLSIDDAAKQKYNPEHLLGELELARFNRSASPQLLSMLNSGNTQYIQGACRVIKLIKSKAKECIPKLIEIYTQTKHDTEAQIALLSMGETIIPNIKQLLNSNSYEDSVRGCMLIRFDNNTNSQTLLAELVNSMQRFSSEDLSPFTIALLQISLSKSIPIPPNISATIEKRHPHLYNILSNTNNRDPQKIRHFIEYKTNEPLIPLAITALSIIGTPKHDLEFIKKFTDSNKFRMDTVIAAGEALNRINK